MRRQIRIFIGAALVSAGIGCADDGETGAAGASSLVNVVDEPAGSNCATGGVAVQTGIDSNANGTLDSTEVSNTDYVCAGAEGAQGATGENCTVTDNNDGTNTVTCGTSTVEVADGDRCILEPNQGCPGGDLVAITLGNPFAGPPTDFGTLDLRGADLRFSRFWVDLEGASFSGANLQGSEIAYLGAINTDFSNMNAQDIEVEVMIVTGGNLDNANFTNFAVDGFTTLTSASANASTWVDADFRGSFECNQTTFVGADFTGADLSSTSIRGCDFTNAVMINANLEDCNIDDESTLAGADLSGASVVNCDLSDLDLSTTTFTGAFFSSSSTTFPSGFDTTSLIDVDGTDFTGVDFTEATTGPPDTTDSNFTDANVTGLDVEGSDFTDSILSGLIAIDSDFSDTDLSDTMVVGADFTRADLRGVDLSIDDGNPVDFTGTTFVRALLTSVDFETSNLTNADLSGATVIDADFSAATLTGVTWTGAYYDNVATTVFPEGFDPVAAGLTLVNPSDDDFSGRSLPGIDLSGRGFSSPVRNFSNADLSGGNFVESDLEGTNLSGTNLSNADLSFANLSEVNGAGANFTGAVLTGIFVEGADLSGANFTGASFVGDFDNSERSQDSNVGFEEVNLTNANFTDADLRGADLAPGGTSGVAQPTLTGVVWSNTTCPDGVNSDAVGGTCDGHLSADNEFDD